LIGIGGAGMSGLALVARELGASVTGSDRADSSYCERLRATGIEPLIGHDAANLPEDAEIVVSTAISTENPELVAALERGARVLHRGELLGEVARLKRCIAIAGTHGKTTTAGMTAHALVACGLDPAFVVGGELRSAGTNAAWGAGEWIVVEADESDRSFLELEPEVAVVTNVELDHHSEFASVYELERAFDEFAAGARVRIAGADVALAGAVERFGIRGGSRPRDEPLGIAAEGVELHPLGSRFTVVADQAPAAGAPVELGVPGAHNTLNALAALAACRAAGLDIERAGAALASFEGAGRRFEPMGRTAGGAEVYDDYAHHPTEVRATLEAARSLGAERVIACFQPHLFSRTRSLAREFGQALALADLVVVVDVYPAREHAEDFPGVSGWLVAAATADAAAGRPVWWLPRLEQARQLLAGELRAGDALLTLGAGDVDGLARGLATAGSSAAAAKDRNGGG